MSAPITGTSARESPSVPYQDRVEALDVLRGIAILGTLASNIWIFTSVAGATAVVVTPQWLSELSAWIPNGKFLGLLTIMFGIGLEIQRQAAVRKGARWPGGYPIRAAILFLDGLLNYIFVVQFDVLRAYAVTGLIVAFLLLTSTRLQWWLIGGFLTLHFVIMALMASRVSPSGTDDGLLASSATAPVDGSPVEGYWDQVLATTRQIGEGFSIDSEFFTIVMMGLGLFLLGANLYRAGIFTAERRALRYWLIGGGFLVALPLDFFLTFSDLSASIFAGFARYGAAAGVALGILALVAEFYQRRTPGAFGRRIAMVGKMALTCYLLQNVLGVLLERNVVSAGYLDNMDNTLTTYTAFFIVSGALIAFAWIWLRYFQRGPFELAWNWCYRALTHSTKRRSSRPAPAERQSNGTGST